MAQTRPACCQSEGQRDLESMHREGSPTYCQSYCVVTRLTTPILIIPYRRRVHASTLGAASDGIDEQFSIA